MPWALLLFATLVTIWSSTVVDSVGQHVKKQYYPDSIPVFEVRRDTYTNEFVSRGRLPLVNYKVSDGSVPPNNDEQKEKMVKFADFHRNLQCVDSPEAELDGNRGSWSMLKMAPPRKQTLEQICAWAELRCHPWLECRKQVDKFKNGGYLKELNNLDHTFGRFRGAVLLRVINNEIYYDCPWGIERFKSQEPRYSNLLTDHYMLLEIVLRMVSDIGDSVFFFGGERAFLRWNIPFPVFSFAPTLSYADYPFPWVESYDLEMNLATEAEGHDNNFTDAFYQRDHRAWKHRIPKAAFFSTFSPYRQVVFDSAALRPDLLDVSFIQGENIDAWNPLSDEPSRLENDPSSVPHIPVPEHNHSGFIQPIMQFADGRHYTPQHYKYVVVPTGSEDKSSSGRLAGLLAHSGAVVLLQASTFNYHFSARLVPWVHYVPLSHSMADLIDKVEWLKRNDEMARQIALNAANYGKSYLRLEDYLCYAASSLRLIHDIEKETDVLKGFSPQRINRTRDN